MVELPKLPSRDKRTKKETAELSKNKKSEQKTNNNNCDSVVTSKNNSQQTKGTAETVNLWRKSTCNNDELYNYLLKNENIDVANKFLKEGK